MFENYLMLMFCVALTIAVLLLIGFSIHLLWNEVIEPIMNRVKNQKDNYWEKRYREELALNAKYLRKLGGLLPSTIDAIIPGTVEILTSHDNCGDFEERCMITFTVDTTELFKEGKR